MSVPWMIRHVLVVMLSALAALSIRTAEMAAGLTRVLPRYCWETQPIVTARRRGLLFTLDLRDNVQRAFYFTGWYERRYLTWILGNLRRGDVFLDVGAHVGIHTLIVAERLKMLGGGMVIAFEPATDLGNALELAIKRNNLQM